MLMVIAVYFAFSQANPFASPFELKGTFANATNIRTNSPVRIAGVEVGKVKKIEPAGDDSTAATITMESRLAMAAYSIEVAPLSSRRKR